MAEQSLGSGGFNVNLDQLQQFDAAMRELTKSSEDMAMYVQNAGKNYDEYIDKFSRITKEQKELTNSFSGFSSFLATILTNMDVMSTKSKVQLDTQKAITVELENQRSIRDKTRGIPGSDGTPSAGVPAVGSPGDYGDRSTNRLIGFLKQQDEKKESQRIASAIGSGVANPMSGLGSLISKVPGLGVAAAFMGPIANIVGDEINKLRLVSRTAGMDIGTIFGNETGGEMGGATSEGALGRATRISAKMRWNALELPFGLKPKLATVDEQQQGTGILTGLGGLSGESLETALDGLAQVAYDAGVKFTDASSFLAKSVRILKDSPEEARQAFKDIVDMARKLGVAPSSYMKFMDDIMKETGKFGTQTKDLNEKLGELYLGVVRGIIPQSTLTDRVITAIKNHENLETTFNDLIHTISEARKGLYDATRVEEANKTAAAALLPIYKDQAVAMNLGREGVAVFSEKIGLGTMAIGAYTDNVVAAKQVFGLTPKAFAEIVDGVDNFAKKLGVSTPEVTKRIMNFGTKLEEITLDPSTSFKEASIIVREFTSDIKKRRISENDLLDIMSNLKEKYGASAGEINAYGKHLIKLSDITNASVSQLKNWTASFSESSREMFDDPKKALFNSIVVTNQFAGMLAKGQMTMGDYDKVMRTQMDTLQEGPEKVFDRFKILADVVDKTNVRMSELTQYTSELSKTNKQYGFDLKESDAILVMFKDGLRSGMMSLQDIKKTMEGGAGTTPGMQALAVTNLQKSSGDLGKIFSGTSITGGMAIMRDFQDFLETGKTTEALDELLVGVDTSEAGRAKMGAEYQSITKGTTKSILDSMGGNTKADKIWLAQQASSTLWGEQLSSKGREREQILKYRTGEALTPTMEEAIAKNKINDDNLKNTYAQFGGNVNTFEKAVQLFVKAANNKETNKLSGVREGTRTVKQIRKAQMAGGTK